MISSSALIFAFGAAAGIWPPVLAWQIADRGGLIPEAPDRFPNALEATSRHSLHTLVTRKYPEANFWQSISGGACDSASALRLWYLSHSDDDWGDAGGAWHRSSIRLLIGGTYPCRTFCGPDADYHVLWSAVTRTREKILVNLLRRQPSRDIPQLSGRKKGGRGKGCFLWSRSHGAAAIAADDSDRNPGAAARKILTGWPHRGWCWRFIPPRVTSEMTRGGSPAPENILFNFLRLMGRYDTGLRDDQSSWRAMGHRSRNAAYEKAAAARGS